MLKTKHVPLLMDFLLSFCVSAFQCNEKLIFLLQNHRCIAFPAVMIIKKNSNIYPIGGSSCWRLGCGTCLNNAVCLSICIPILAIT